MKLLRMGEAVHDAHFDVLRPAGHPCYLLLLVQTPADFEDGGEFRRTQPGTAVIYRPGQRHRYRAAGEPYIDFWAYIQSPSPLLFEEFPFGKPLPLHGAERFYQIFRIMLDEFFGTRKTKESVLSALGSALIDMIAAEVDIQGELFHPLLSLREDIFRTPYESRRAEDAAAGLGISQGYFHVLYRRYFQTTFVSDVIAARIQLAEELLLSTAMSVERIAERCGYVSVEHFIRQFKQHTGTTPHRFRTKGGNP